MDMKRLLFTTILLIAGLLTARAQDPGTPTLEYVMQITDNTTGRTNVEAIYSIRTDDGAYIHVRNNGIIATGNDENGNPSFYFRCAPKFEAPADSGYAWLNNALFVCAPDFSGPQGTITLKVWKVN